MPYTALITCEVRVNALVVHVAWPFAGFTPTAVGHAAMGFPLSVNVTEPESFTAFEKGVTVAVNVTDWLTLDGFAEDVRLVELEAAVTV